MINLGLCSEVECISLIISNRFLLYVKNHRTKFNSSIQVDLKCPAIDRRLWPFSKWHKFKGALSMISGFIV